MEVQGKIIAALPARSGESKRNPGEMWMSQDFVVETHDQYSRKMVFTVFGKDRLQRFNIQVGQEVLVSFDIDAREWNGRWFNDVRAYDVRLVDPATLGQTGAVPYAAAPFAAAPAAASAVAPATAPAAPFAPAPAVESPFPPAPDDASDDNLPF